MTLPTRALDEHTTAVSQASRNLIQLSCHKCILSHMHFAQTILSSAPAAHSLCLWLRISSEPPRQIPSGVFKRRTAELFLPFGFLYQLLTFEREIIQQQFSVERVCKRMVCQCCGGPACVGVVELQAHCAMLHEHREDSSF